MQVDRATFIALTLTIAAGGCGVQPSRGVPAAGSGGPAAVPIPPVSHRSHPAGPLADAAADGQGGSGTTQPRSPSSTVDEPREHDPSLPPSERALLDRLRPLTRANTGCGPVRPPHPPPPPGWLAEEPPPRPLVGQAKRCAPIKRPWELPGPHCESWSLDCEEAVSALKPPAGRRTISCLRRKSGTRGICGYNVVTRCVIDAIRGTRALPATQAVCDLIVANCRGTSPRGGATPLTLDDCRRYLSSVDCPQTEEAGFRLAYECALEPTINPLW